LEASVGQHDFMERVSQFNLFVEESVILTHIYCFTFFYNSKEIQESLKMNINVPLHTISAWGNSIVNGIFMGNIQL